MSEDTNPSATDDTLPSETESDALTTEESGPAVDAATEESVLEEFPSEHCRPADVGARKCPDCGAGYGQPCVDRSGKPLTGFLPGPKVPVHSSRCDGEEELPPPPPAKEPVRDVIVARPPVKTRPRGRSH